MVLKIIKFQKGQIWWFDPDPVQGREQGKKTRPVLIISGNQFNSSRAGLVTIIPCTTQNKKIVSHILLEEKKLWDEEEVLRSLRADSNN